MTNEGWMIITEDDVAPAWSCPSCFAWDAEESFNAKIAPALESYTKDELISSMAGPQGSASYDEMVYDPVSQSRLSAEENR